MNIPSDLTTVTKMVQDAYVYAYPLPLMYITQQKATTVPIDPAEIPSHVAPLNVFCNMKNFPDAKFKDVVRPNLDTLYSSAWLDLSRGPLVLKLPNTNARYYLMPILSAWTDVIASPGMRTNLTAPSTAAQDFLLVGPGWKGHVPPCFDSAHVIHIPTNMAWISGRTKANANNPGDVEKVNELQDQYQLVPLADYLQDPTGEYHPDLNVPVNLGYPTETPPALVAELSQGMAEGFFNLFARLLVQNPPLPGDEEMVDELEQLGITPGKAVDWSDQPQDVQDAIADGVQQGIKAIQDGGSQVGKNINGWVCSTSGIGDYQPPGEDHDNYVVRAYIASTGLGANLPQDAVYPTSANLNIVGSKNYTLHFTKVPPVNPAAFWSLTAYEGNYFIASVNKHSINSGDKPICDKDGSLTLYIQSEQPDDTLLPNWLPIDHDGTFNLTLRLYWPDQSVLSNDWAPPVIQPASVAQARKVSTAA